MKITLTISVTILLYGTLLFAGGFQINDHSGRSVGMAFSTVANPTDASAIFFNPAAINELDGNSNLSLGLSYIMPGSKFTGFTSMNQQNTTDLENWNFAIPHFFGTWKTPLKNLSLGVGVFVPFGLGTQWPDDWVGRHSALKTYLQTIEINPVLSYKFYIINVPISIAAGYGYSIGNVELKKALSTFTPEVVLTLKGDGTASTFNFGLLVEPISKMKIGASYRHNIEMNYDGNTTYENTQGLTTLFQEGNGKATINFPNDLRFGISYQVTDKLSLEAGINYMGWSSYDTLKIVFDKGPGNPSQSYTSSSPRNYKDVITYRIAGEYLFDNSAIRLGFYYDPLAVDAKNVEPVLPESNRLGFTAGFGYKIADNFNVDLGYLGIYGTQTEVKDNPNGFDGYYNTWANIISLTFSYTIK
jgi:long-chain fatty acid transport protein